MVEEVKDVEAVEGGAVTSTPAIDILDLLDVLDLPVDISIMAHILGAMASLLLRAAPLFAALADPMRLAILDRLRSGERSVNELCGDTAASQSLMSFHLKTLRDAGLVFARKEGRTVWYALDPSGVARLERLVSVLQGRADEASEASKRVDLEVCLEYINDG